MNTSPIEKYLTQRGIYHYKTGKEIVAHCIFNDCDKDSHGKEAHLYIDAITGCYQCKKCLEQGNWITLLKYLGDDPNDYPLTGYTNLPRPESPKSTQKKIILTEKDIGKYQKNLPDTVREYLHNRGITDAIIEERQLGYGSFYGSNWITIPIRDQKGELQFLKLRRDPDGPDGNKYMFYPNGYESMLYGAENLQNNDDYIVICEGEFDQMLLGSEGLMAITSTGGAGTFKEGWINQLSRLSNIYICFDNDDAGKKGAEKLIERLSIRYPEKEIHKISLPPEMGKDISEFFKNGGTIDDMMDRHRELIRSVDTSRFSPLNSNDLIRILGLTIKHDNLNKVIVFLAMLSAFTEDSQINVLLNAPSSSGKTYIPIEVAKLFPEESIMSLLYVSQSAFFHENGEYDKERNEKHIHLERKIIIFMDQPRTELLARLRPLLSHDAKMMTCKITDKSGQGGNKTKNIIIHGYPVAIFCTASTHLDEQEATRFLLLSPETHTEKFRDTIHAKIQSESIDQSHQESLESHPEKILLKERIELIKNAHIKDIRISDTTEVEKRFMEDKKYLKPRHQRDIGRFMSLIKAFALLNLPYRKRINDTLYTEKEDIDEAWSIWKELSSGQEYNISPYAMQIYKEVFIPAYRDYNKSLDTFKSPSTAIGVPRRHIIKKHSEIYGRLLSDAMWRQEIEPTLVNSGLLTTETVGKNIIISPTEEISWNTTQ